MVTPVPSSPLLYPFDEKQVTDATHTRDKVTRLQDHEGEDYRHHPCDCLQQS